MKRISIQLSDEQLAMLDDAAAYLHLTGKDRRSKAVGVMLARASYGIVSELMAQRLIEQAGKRNSWTAKAQKRIGNIAQKLASTISRTPSKPQ